MRAELQPTLLAARTLPREELPPLLADVEEVRAVLLARVRSCRGRTQVDTPDASDQLEMNSPIVELLTVAEIA